MVIEFKGKKGHEHRGFLKDDREKGRKKVLEDFDDDSESDEDFKMPSEGVNMLA